MPFPREEVQATVDRYHELRRRIDEGLEPDAFGALADFYTEDAVYVDGAWGRLEGRDTIAHWLVDSMLGMEDWKFPIEFTAIEGNDVVVKWTQIMPRLKPDGTPYRQTRLLAPHLRRQREVLLRGGHLQHGPRPRGRRSERVAAPRRVHELPPGSPGPEFRHPAGRAGQLGAHPVFPELPKPGNPPPPKGFEVLPDEPDDCCCCACCWFPSVAFVVRLLSPT